MEQYSTLLYMLNGWVIAPFPAMIYSYELSFI